ncbi:MAG: lysine 5,6-aminomutase subunit alpha [Bacillota bacterium]
MNMATIRVDPALVEEATGLARQIVLDVKEHIDAHTTTSVERACCRLLDIDGVDDQGVPLPNVVVESVAQAGRLGRGITYWLANASLATGEEPAQLAQECAAGRLDLLRLPSHRPEEVLAAGRRMAARAVEALLALRNQREELAARLGSGPRPWLYVIVATGNIHEDVLQAQAAVAQGADIIAVIRSTGQSLLDYVPHGPTTEGFGGTYATRANFRIMRQALDECGEKHGRYIRLVNYCSGLCMPEIAALGALERLDVMLNDAMYGILFRDINMKRTLVDQFFSRMINGFAGTIINTGEDNYLTTDDAVRAHHTVLASQFINLEFARLSGIPDHQVGLGHAFQVDPATEDAFLYELAMASLVRAVFPDCPIKFMPPTKYKTGDIFRAGVLDTLFNLVSVATGQDIHLLGMATEAIHTPYLQDRYLAISQARLVMNAGRHLFRELEFAAGGAIEARARAVLEQAVQLLRELADLGLMAGLEQGLFAQVRRRRDGGKGLDGVVRREDGYFNPFVEYMLGERGV